MSVKNIVEQIFFELLRAGLWERGARLTTINNDDFRELSRLSEEQSATGLIAAGIEHVVGVKLCKENVLQLVGQALQIEQSNISMNTFIGDLVTKMQEKGIRTLLVKGQGVAQCYERPLWRACGDIDFLLDARNFEKAKSFLLPLAQEVENESKYAKHLGMTIDGWVVELHGSLRCGLSKRIDKVLDDIQNDSCNKGNTRVWKNGEVDVLLPAVNNDVLFVFTHFLNHFYKEGVGVRQICDWCRLLWTYSDKLDVDLLESRLRRMGLISEWKAFGAFAVDYLGLAQDAMPLYDNSKKWKRKALLIESFVLEVGNFGHNRDFSYYNKYPFFIRKAISVSHRLRDVLRHARLFPVDSIRFFHNMIWVGLQNASIKNANEILKA